MEWSGIELLLGDYRVTVVLPHIGLYFLMTWQVRHSGRYTDVVSLLYHDVEFPSYSKWKEICWNECERGPACFRLNYSIRFNHPGKRISQHAFSLYRIIHCLFLRVLLAVPSFMQKSRGASRCRRKKNEIQDDNDGRPGNIWNVLVLSGAEKMIDFLNDHTDMAYTDRFHWLTK